MKKKQNCSHVANINVSIVLKHYFQHRYGMCSVESGSSSTGINRSSSAVRESVFPCLLQFGPLVLKPYFDLGFSHAEFPGQALTTVFGQVRVLVELPLKAGHLGGAERRPSPLMTVPRSGRPRLFQSPA